MIPCQKRVAAKRDSKNRPKGTMEYKDRAVTAQYTVEMLEEIVYPQFEHLFQNDDVVGHHQTDNARAHTAKHTTDWKDLYATFGKVKRMPDQQAPRCPESNVMDLSVFSWLQDFVDHQECVTRKDLVLAVLRGWEEMPESVILNAYSHLPKVHAGIVERNGGNRSTDGT